MKEPETLQQAYQFCDRIARRRAHNFYPAFRFLSRRRRLALSAFYAFCSLSDDISDDNNSLLPAERQQKLREWRVSLERCFAEDSDPSGNPPVFLALQSAIRQFALPQEPFNQILQGIEMDLEPRRYATFADLEIYCRCVASAVGRVSVRIFGCTHPEADIYADNLGIALQLTNIARDLAEDIARDRLYLPLEDLDRFAYSETDLRRHVYNRHFLDLMEFQYSRAHAYFGAANPLLAQRQEGRLFPAQIMKAVYRQTLEEIHRRNFRVFSGKISLPWWRKAAAIARTAAEHYF